MIKVEISVASFFSSSSTKENNFQDDIGHQNAKKMGNEKYITKKSSKEGQLDSVFYKGSEHDYFSRFRYNILSKNFCKSSGGKENDDVAGIGNESENENGPPEKNLNIKDIGQTLRKTIPVLFSSHSPKSQASPFYCVLPWIVNMEFYGPNDLSLGAFLEEFCFSDRYKCPNKVCDAPMRDHIRRFVHGSGSLTMYVHELGKLSLRKSNSKPKCEISKEHFLFRKPYCSVSRWR